MTTVEIIDDKIVFFPQNFCEKFGLECVIDLIANDSINPDLIKENFIIDEEDISTHSLNYGR
jgi:hypothetical protein